MSDLENRDQEPISREQFEEIKQIMDAIDKNNLPSPLINARKIREWMDKQEDTTRPPSRSAKDSEEKVLGEARRTIKQALLKRI